MFTGLIETVGEVTSWEVLPASVGARLTLTPGADFAVKDGDSVAVNGCCLTVSRQHAGKLFFDVSQTTLGCTTFGNLRQGHKVNLERAMLLSDRLGGHLVSGHVDGVGHIVEIRPGKESTVMNLLVPKPLHRFLIDKGSICVNGVSLTVNEYADEAGGALVSLTLIPTTLSKTNLTGLKVGDAVNLEMDLVAKYISRMAETSKNS